MSAETFNVTSTPQRIPDRILTDTKTYRAQNHGNTAAANEAFQFKGVPFLYLGSFDSGTTPTRDDVTFLYYPMEDATLKPVSTEEIWVWCRNQGSTSILVIEETS